MKEGNDYLLKARQQTVFKCSVYILQYSRWVDGIVVQLVRDFGDLALLQIMEQLEVRPGPLTSWYNYNAVRVAERSKLAPLMNFFRKAHNGHIYNEK